MEILPAMISPENSARPISPPPPDPIVHLQKPTPMSLASATDSHSFLKSATENSGGSTSIHPPIGKSIEHMPPKKAHLLLMQAQMAQRDVTPAPIALPPPPPVVQQEPTADTAAERAEEPMAVDPTAPPAHSTSSPSPATPATAATTSSAGVPAGTAASSAAHSAPPQMPPVTAAAPSASPNSSRVTFATMRGHASMPPSRLSS
jgi:hypothetical protein